MRGFSIDMSVSITVVVIIGNKQRDIWKRVEKHQKDVAQTAQFGRIVLEISCLFIVCVRHR